MCRHIPTGAYTFDVGATQVAGLEPGAATPVV